MRACHSESDFGERSKVGMTHAEEGPSFVVCGSCTIWGWSLSKRIQYYKYKIRKKKKKKVSEGAYADKEP